MRYGLQHVLEHIDECVPVECFQGAVFKKSHGLFRVFGFYRPEPYAKPTDLLVGVGKVAVPLGELVSTGFGRDALCELLHDCGPGRQFSTSISSADFSKAFRVWDFESHSVEVYQARLDHGRCLLQWGSKGIMHSYERNDLAQTAGGRALLDTLEVQHTVVRHDIAESAWGMSEDDMECGSVGRNFLRYLCLPGFGQRW